MNDHNPSDLKQPASAGQIEIHSSPVVVHHKREAWLYEHPEALASVRRGLEQSAKGETQSPASFAQFADDELD